MQSKSELLTLSTSEASLHARLFDRKYGSQIKDNLFIFFISVDVLVPQPFSSQPLQLTLQSSGAVWIHFWQAAESSVTGTIMMHGGFYPLVRTLLLKQDHFVIIL
jgi:hypothetical protein